MPSTQLAQRNLNMERKASNAAHHAPAGPTAFDDIMCVAGRVHALVRLRGTILIPALSRFALGFPRAPEHITYDSAEDRSNSIAANLT
jgi:hypothetical protein